MQRALRFDVTYPHPPAKVWRVLTTREHLARWLMENDFVPQVGHRFQFRAQPVGGWDGIVHGEVLELEPERRLVLAWKSNVHRYQSHVPPRAGRRRNAAHADPHGLQGAQAGDDELHPRHGLEGTPQQGDSRAHHRAGKGRVALTMAARNRGRAASENGTINGIGDEAVRAKTGKTWGEWIATLDAAGAREMEHPAIATLLHEKFGVPGWWTQMVTVGYEQATGKRVPRQKADGFAASASKTLNVSAVTAFRAFNDARNRARWLPDELTIRKATAPKSLRITWGDGKTHVDVNIYPKGERKAQVTLQHTRLASAREAARMKKYWGEALARLEETLAG